SLLDRLKRRTRQLEIIHSIVTQSQREADLEKALDRIEAALREYLQVDAFMFYEIKGDQLTLHRAYTGVDEWAKEKKKIGVCLCGLAAEKKEMVLSSNILTDYRCSLDECKRAGIKSFVAIPLFVEENLIGLIGIAWKETRDFAEERDFFEALGAGLSVSLQNIKLIEELKQHSQNLELMVRERTEQLQKAVNLMAGREVRMAELKEVIRNLKEQLRAAGLEPEVDDPLGMDDA
ncbi:MAG: GAF domain-containing protein, partial [Nitrospirae bacterium]